MKQKFFLIRKFAFACCTSFLLLYPSLVIHATDSARPLLQKEKDQQAKRTITGQVTDANTKETIIGASIQIKGTDKRTVTDIDGNFSMTVSSNKDVLVVSYLGYKTVEREVEDLGVINIELPSSTELLNDVVVVGYGVQKKVSVVGSITNIEADKLKVPSSSLSSSFAGRLAGVITNTTNGDPSNANATNFYVRGIGTFGGRATPLIMLDGVEISSRELSYIPAESIKSFSILKDASATAIYGARGANGVMLITTKAGKENEKTRINVSAESSINVPMDFPEFVDGVTYMKMYNEAQYSRTQSMIGLPYSREKIANTAKRLNPYVYPDVNWKDMMFKSASFSQRANINVTGGGSKANYYLSLQANHDSGVLNTKKLYSFDNNVNVWNYIFQSNVDYKLTPSTKVGLRMNAQLTDTSGPATDTGTLFSRMINANPVTFPAYFPSDAHASGAEHMLFGNAYYTGDLLYTNPYADMLTTYKSDFQANILTTVNLEQKLDFITEGLALKGLVSFKNYADASYTRTVEPYFYMPTSGSYDKYDPYANGFQIERIGTSGTDYIKETANPKMVERTFQFQFSLEWARKFKQLHDVSAMLLYLQREYRANANVLPTRNQGVSGRFTYAYDSRYLFEANFGYNGTERLASGHRFEFFPSFAAGWVVSNEKFFEPLSKTVTNLKIRGSWGLVGNDETGLTDIRTGAQGPHFIYLTDVTLGSQGYLTGVDMSQDYYGPTINLYGVRNATWERSEKINLGIDIELFSKFSLTADIFRDNRRNILLRRERFPEYMGYGNAKPWASIGKAKNEGIELALNYRDDFGKDWSIDARGTFTYNKSTMVYSDEPVRDEEYRQRDGKPLNSTWGYVAERLFVDQADIDNSPTQLFGNNPMPGDIKYKDMNGDGMITSADQCMISPYGSTPNIIYGFGATVRYKKFDVGFFFQGAANRTIMVSGIQPFGTTRRNVLQFIADDYWTEENPNPHAAYPRLEYRDNANNNTQPSTYWMRNGSYLRLKNAEIGYSFKYGRVYLNGSNLLTFSPFKLWDPEVSGWSAYPLSRVFNLGVQMTF
jgi:TonB-linked SusC/RagA family outer membrane protein